METETEHRNEELGGGGKGRSGDATGAEGRQDTNGEGHSSFPPRDGAFELLSVHNQFSPRLGSGRNQLSVFY